MRNIVADFRSNKGTGKPTEETEDEKRSPMPKAFNEAKGRRAKETEERKKKDGERAATDRWNEEDHETSTKLAANEEGEDDHKFFIASQELLPHMLHSEIDEDILWAKITEGKGKRRGEQNKKWKQRGKGAKKATVKG